MKKQELGNWNWRTHNSVLGTEVKLDKLEAKQKKKKVYMRIIW